MTKVWGKLPMLTKLDVMPTMDTLNFVQLPVQALAPMWFGEW